MDFLMRLPITELKHDAIWVVVDRLMQSAHFIPFRAMYSQKILVLRLVSYLYESTARPGVAAFGS